MRIISDLFKKRVQAGSQWPRLVEFNSGVQEVLDAAAIVSREPNDDGPRTVVISRTLGLAFVFTHEDAAARIQRGFPELSARGVKRATEYLAAKVANTRKQPLKVKRRRSWIHSWADDDHFINRF